MRCLAWVAAREGLGTRGTLAVDTGGGRRASSSTSCAGTREVTRGHRRHGSGHLRARADPGRRADRRSASPPTSTARTTRATPPGWATRTSCCSSTTPPPPASPSTVRTSSTTTGSRSAPTSSSSRVTPGADRRARHAGVGARGGGDAVLRHRRVRGRRRRAPARPGRRRASPCTSPAATSVELPSSARHHPSRRSRRARVRRRGRPRRRPAVAPTRARRHRVSRRRLTATEVDLDVVRQRALLVGTGIGTRDVEAAEASLDELALPHRHRRRRAGRARAATTRHARSRHLHRLGQGEGAAASSPRRSTSTSWSSTTSSRPAQQRNLEKLFERRRRRPRRADPRHLRPARARARRAWCRSSSRSCATACPRLRGRGNQLSQQGAGGIGDCRHRGPGETQLEVDRRRIQTRVRRLERDLDRLAQEPRHATQGSSPQRALHRRARRLHERGEVDAAQPPHRRRTCSSRTGCSPRSTPPPAGCRSPAARRCSSPTPSGSCSASRTSWSSRSGPRSTRWSTPTSSCTSSTPARPTPSSRSHAVHTVLHEIGADEVPELLVLNKVDVAAPRPGQGPAVAAPATPSWCRRSPVKASTVLLDTLGARLRALAPIVELLVPYERGDVVAALHREGEVLVEVHAEGGSRLRARLPAPAVTRFDEFVVSPTRRDRRSRRRSRPTNCSTRSRSRWWSSTATAASASPTTRAPTRCSPRSASRTRRRRCSHVRRRARRRARTRRCPPTRCPRSGRCRTGEVLSDFVMGRRSTGGADTVWVTVASQPLPTTTGRSPR